MPALLVVSDRGASSESRSGPERTSTESMYQASLDQDASVTVALGE
jgi:hypothetical protein